MTCPRCGVETADSARQCRACGEDLGALRAGDLVAARWEVQARIGSGGMGVVYKALDRELDEVVALKVLRGDLAHSEEMGRRFRSEIKLARRVRHPNVCAIHEYGQDGALRFIVMEFVEGVDLKRVLAGGGLPHDEALEVGAQIAAALHAIHQAGIVHRDLKPANVMLDAQGRVRLMDFGIAKRFGAEPGSGLTATGHIVGTPEYMSPEQVRGDTLDVRSDVYSLGTVLYEAFTGRVPFRGNTAMATLYATVHDPVPVEAIQAARVPGPVTQVLLRALAKSPDERYATAADLERALAAARGAAPAPPQRPHTTALVRSALALQPEAAPETTPLPALPPTPVPAAVPTAVPVAVSTVERRAYAGPSPRERAAARAADEPAPRRAGRGVALVALAAAVAGVAAWRYEPRLRAALGLGSPPSMPPAVAPVADAASTAPPVVASLPAPANIVPAAAPSTTPRPSAAASAAPTPAATALPAPPVPSAAPATPEPGAPPVAPRAEATVDRAEDLFAQGRFASALAEAKAVLQREPGNTQAQQLAEDAEVELMVEKRLKEARDAMQAGDRDLAIEKLKLGLAAKPTDARLLALWREITSS
jgi:eukaryotic-like serine/threonine-protein kinase